MEATSWLKQGSEPLFPELQWNKPERRDQAGKLLIIGGNAHNLSAPAAVFERVQSHGIGSVVVALPNKTKRLVGYTLPEALFLPSTPSGEFSIEGEAALLEQAVWADSIMLAGDLGRNSQTTILLSTLLQNYHDRVVVCLDAIDALTHSPKTLLEREKTTVVASFAQLQKLVKEYGEATPLVFSMDLVKLVTFLQDFTKRIPAQIASLHHDQLIVAVSGKVSTTKLSFSQEHPPHWRLNVATYAACYQTWYPSQPFEALTESANLFATEISV